MAEGQGRSSNQGVKLLYIRDYLHKYTNKEHPKSAKEISEYLASKGIKADRKTIYNDILRLQVDFQEPIEYNPKKWGYYISEPIFSLYELQILTDCVRASSFLSAEEVSSINKRISELTNVYDCEKLNSMAWLDKKSPAPINSELYNVDIIQRAIEQNRKIRFRLFQYSPTNSNRASNGKEYVESHTGSEMFIVSPREVVRLDGHYMLAIYCNDLRIEQMEDYLLHVRHMEDIEILPSERECDDSQRPKEEIFRKIDFNEICTKFANPEIYVHASTEEERYQILQAECEKMKDVLVSAEAELFDMVFYYDYNYATTLLFRKEDAIYILDEFGYDTVLVPRDEDYCTATIRITISRHFFTWLFSHHTMVRIEAPAVATNMYQRYVDAVSKQYAYKNMDLANVIVEFMQLMDSKVENPTLLNALKEQYPIIEVDDSVE